MCLLAFQYSLKYINILGSVIHFLIWHEHGTNRSDRCRASDVKHVRVSQVSGCVKHTHSHWNTQRLKLILTHTYRCMCLSLYPHMLRPQDPRLELKETSLHTCNQCSFKITRWTITTENMHEKHIRKCLIHARIILLLLFYSLLYFINQPQEGAFIAARKLMYLWFIYLLTIIIIIYWTLFFSEAKHLSSFVV